MYKLVPETDRPRNGNDRTIVTTSSNNNNTDALKDQLHDLRLDMRRLQVNGIAGNALFWWVHPMKFLADPVFEAAEALVPAITEKVPYSDSLVGLGLDVTKTVSHTIYGVTASTGLVTSNEAYESIRTLTQLQALKDQSDLIKGEFLKGLYAEAGKQMFLMGVHESVFKSFTSHREELLTLMYQGYTALYNYASDAEIFAEANEMGHLRYFENKALLGMVQQADLDQRNERRHEEMLMDKQEDIKRDIFKEFPLEEAEYYMKFATAAYGDNGIRSTKIDNEHVFDCRLGDLTLTRASEHTGIPPEDFVEFDIHYEGDVQNLRYFIALDHGRNKIILSIRGTYTYREVMIDFNGYSREFLGGQAHSAISIMAERLWEKLSTKILELMDQYLKYELIVTGHSLGGGSTCLMNLLLHADVRMKGRKWRAFAYASPPVYVPLSNVSEQAKTCVNYINQYDGVPFLSGDSVRHQVAMIAAIQKADLDLIQRGRILLGFDQVDTALIQQIHDIQHKPLPETKDGCPRNMAVPAWGNVWMVRNNEQNTYADTYKVVIADSIKMSETGIFIHKEDLADHLPARYEYAFKRLVV